VCRFQKAAQVPLVNLRQAGRHIVQFPFTTVGVAFPARSDGLKKTTPRFVVSGGAQIAWLLDVKLTARPSFLDKRGVAGRQPALPNHLWEVLWYVAY